MPRRTETRSAKPSEAPGGARPAMYLTGVPVTHDAAQSLDEAGVWRES